MMDINEEFLNYNDSNKIEIKIDLLKWLHSVFDTYEGDYYFPWNNIDNWIKIYNEVNNSDYIKYKVKKIQLELIENGGDIKLLFQREFGVSNL
jgi:hypothetical protein